MIRPTLLALLVTAVIAQSPADRARALLAKMALDDKIAMLHGVASPGYTGMTVANPALAIPSLKLNDGRQGFRPNDGSNTETAFPCQLAVVSTFDINLMNSFGAAMGAEFAGKGANVVLAPMLILARVPEDGRTFESIGEDPELAFAMAREHVRGVQSVPGVIANADDFVLNNQETARGSISAVCDERTRFELYYRGYAGAIEGGVGSFMCSYNRVNGTYSCENPETLRDLKGVAGLNFSGWVLSDWGGTHSTVAAALAGLDQEMPGDSYFGPALLAAVQSGQVPESVIDDKVLRILTPMFASGLMDLPPCPTCTEDANVTSPAHTALARRIGAAGAVLMSNPRGALPVQPGVRSIVVVGDDCDVSPDCCGAGSGALYPPYVISPLQGITERAGPLVNVSYYPTPAGYAALTQFYAAARGDHFLDFQCVQCPDGMYTPLRVEGYASPTPCAGCIELALFWNVVNMSNLVAAADFPPPPGYAYVRPLAYTLPLSAAHTPAAVNMTTLELWHGLDTPTGQPQNSHGDYFTLATDASRAEAVAAGYIKVGDVALVASSPTSPDFEAVATAAAAADLAIMCISVPSSEGADRSDLNLTATDDALIAAVTAAQPSTVVTLNIPGAVIMPWADAAAAILVAWFPGQEMGHALADILWGDVNPSGRTPLTFPARSGDSPMQTPEQWPGVDGVATYTEKLEIGYRWFDATNTTPLFPFGHGLSYTTFEYDNLQITPNPSGGLNASFSVRNTGARDGREVPQLYLSFPVAAGEPPRSLRGFTVVDIPQGSSVPVTFTLSLRDLSIWSEETYAWAPVAGNFTVSIGASSRDIRLSGTFMQ